jgi:hypothetical protein
MGLHLGRRALLLGAAVALVVAGCSSSDDPEDDAGGSPTDSRDPASETTETSEAAATTGVPAFGVVGEVEVDGNFRQGLARSGDGWIVVTNKTIYRTDGAFVQTEDLQDAIPPDLAAQGYDHLGDPDVVDGVVWVPAERPDKDEARQVTVRYDEETLEVIDWFEVAQHHNAFVTVDEDGVVYSADEFGDDTIVRYRVVDGEVEQLDPLPLSRFVDRIQGGDVAGGALWLSTDDERNGVYRVDLETGEVTEVGSAGHVDGEGEGIDASDGDPATLHVLVADEAIVPMWVVEMAPDDA